MVGTAADLTGAATSTAAGYPYKYAKNTGATVWQHAIGSFQSTGCLTIRQATLSVTTASSRSNPSFATSHEALSGATQHGTRHDARSLLDGVMRPIAHETPGYYISNGAGKYKFSVNEAPLLAPEYQNDIRVISFFVVFFSVSHLVVYHALFGELFGSPVTRQSFIEITEGLLTQSNKGSPAERAPLVNAKSQQCRTQHKDGYGQHDRLAAQELVWV